MSVISAIRSRFAIGQQHSSSFSNQQNAAAKTSMSRGAEGADEVSYSVLNDKDSDFDIQMMQDSLDYEAFKTMEESDREMNR